MTDELAGILSSTSWWESDEPQKQLSISGNKLAIGSCLPELYGTLRIKPPKLYEYVESNNLEQRINILYAVAKWGVDSITDIRINGDDLSDYPEIPEPDIRLGTNNQAVIQAFTDIKTDTRVEQDLTTSYITKSALSADNTGFGIGLFFPDGLYAKYAGETINPATVYVTIQYKAHNSSTWITLWQVGGLPAAAETGHWSGGYFSTQTEDGSYIWREVEAGGATPTDHTEGDYYEPDPAKWSIAGLDGHDFSRYVHIWHWVTAGDIILPEGTPESTQYIEITGASDKPFRTAYFRTGLPGGQYDIRAKLYQDINTDDELNIYTDRVQWEYYREIIEDAFIFPNTALLALSAIPGQKLQNSISNVDMLATRAYVYAWNPNTSAYEAKSASNPAWICYDLIHKARALYNINTDQIEAAVFGQPAEYLSKYWADWVNWAAWCDWDSTSPYTNKKPYSCHLYLDTVMSLQDRLDQVAAHGRGAVKQVGKYFRPIAELPDLSAFFTVSQRFTFSAGNIRRDSFTETITMAPDRANLITVTYKDPDNFYANDTVRIPSSDYDSTTQPQKTTSVSLAGCCNRAMAAAYGKYLLNRNQFLTAVSSWTAFWDSIHCEVGDIVEAPAEFSGRLLTGSTTGTLNLDSEVVLEAGKSYRIIISYLSDDTRVEATVTSAAGTRSVLTVTGLSQAPPVDSKWLFGEVGQPARLRRVTNISRDADLYARITAEEFNSAIFEDAITIPVTPFNPYRRKFVPPALDSVSLSLDWVFDSLNKDWIPHIKVVFNPDLTFDYQSLTIPISAVRIYAHAEPGNTVSLPMTAGSYGTVFDIKAATLDTLAAPFNNQTLYVTASLVNAQGIEGPKCTQVKRYVSTAFTPILTTNSIENKTYDYEGNGPNGYIVYFNWVPYGWRLNTGKYEPILSWNGGSNYFSFTKYLVLFAVVDDNGVNPTLDIIQGFETADIGNIYNADGSMITDATTLDQICRGAACAGIPLSYSNQWVAIAAMPLMKHGGQGILDMSQADFGLDWDWIQVTCPGGTGSTVTDVQVQNAELLYSMQAGGLFLNSMTWEYTLTAPNISGFAVIYRTQPYQWSWSFGTALASTDTNLTTIINKMNWSTGGGVEAVDDFCARYLEWAATPAKTPHFYLMVTDANYHEIIRVDTVALTVHRGQEGTTARNFAVGSVLSYSPCEQIDTVAILPDTTQRAYVFSPPVEINFALHCTIIAYKAITEAPGYKRSKYAYWDTVQLR